MVNTDYLRSAFDIKIFKERGTKAIALAKYVKFLKKFDSIAFTGMSGATFASMISFNLNVPMIAVRKARDNCHSNIDVEGDLNTKKYLIVDDFIASGSTIKRIIKKMASVSNAKPVAILLYNSGADYNYNCNGIILPVYSIKR